MNFVNKKISFFLTAGLLTLAMGCGSQEGQSANSSAGTDSSKVETKGADQAPAIETPVATVQNVNAKDLKSMIDSDPSLIVLDVRSVHEWDKGTLVNAMRLDSDDPEFDSRIKAMDRNSPIAVYSNGGDRSQKVAQRLVDEGYRTVYHLEGGMDAWLAAGFKLK